MLGTIEQDGNQQRRASDHRVGSTERLHAGLTNVSTTVQVLEAICTDHWNIRTAHSHRVRRLPSPAEPQHVARRMRPEANPLALRGAGLSSYSLGSGVPP